MEGSTGGDVHIRGVVGADAWAKTHIMSSVGMRDH